MQWKGPCIKPPDTRNHRNGSIRSFLRLNLTSYSKNWKPYSSAPPGYGSQWNDSILLGFFLCLWLWRMKVVSMKWPFMNATFLERLFQLRLPRPSMNCAWTGESQQNISSRTRAGNWTRSNGNVEYERVHAEEVCSSSWSHSQIWQAWIGHTKRPKYNKSKDVTRTRQFC